MFWVSVREKPISIDMGKCPNESLQLRQARVEGYHGKAAFRSIYLSLFQWLLLFKFSMTKHEKFQGAGAATLEQVQFTRIHTGSQMLDIYEAKE